MSRYTKKRKNKRQRVFDKTGGRCCYCGEKLDYDDFHMDHMTPLSQGGEGYDISNLQPCCCNCNLVKGPRNVEEFRYKLTETIFERPVVNLLRKYHSLKKRQVVFYFEKMERRQRDAETN